MTINDNLTPSNYTRRGDTSRIKYIVVHYFGGLCSAKVASIWFANPAAMASAHYCVGDYIWRCVQDGDIAWHCGDSGRGTHKDLCTNSNSIGIEMRPLKTDVTTCNDASQKDWYFHERTIENVIPLIQMLMKQYNVPIQNVIRHYDVTGKLCPRPFMGNDINSYYGKTGNEVWAEFKARLEDENMTGEQIYNNLTEYLKQQPVPAWAEKELKSAVDAGVTDGSDPMTLIPRYQAAIMAYRAANGKK